jgi:hypothetical protein
MSYDVGVWTWNPEGYPEGSVLYYGPILFPAGINPNTTQTAVCVFGPAGGRANFPPLQQGPPGLPPQFTYGGTTTLAPGAAAYVDQVMVSPGGNGVAPVYENFYGIPKGDPGTPAANTLISPRPSDLENAPAAGQMIGYDAVANKAQWQPIPFLFIANIPSASIATTGTGAGQIRTLSYMTMPAQTLPYIPLVFADTVTTGTINTQIDLVARLGGAPNTNTGIQIGRGRGQIGAVTGTNPWVVDMIPNFANALSGGTETVSVGATPTIYLNAEQQNTLTADGYSTGVTSYTVIGVPV